jgi:hypothetical protein
MDPFIIIGFAGSVLVLSAFFLNQTDRLSTKSFLYDVVNVVGALFLVLYALHAAAWPFVLTNVVWFLVSFRDVTMSLLKR